MSLENKVVILKEACFLNHEDDIEIVEDILNEFYYAADNKIIVDLCSVFHDEIGEISITIDLITTIFYIIKRCGVEDGLSKVIEGMSLILPQANDCAILLYSGILQNEELIAPFINVLRKAMPSRKEEVISILKWVGDDQPKRYLETVNYILKEVI